MYNDKFEIPDTIYLQCHDDDGDLLHPDDAEITWCEDDIDGHNVKYVRVNVTQQDAKKCPECDQNLDSGMNFCAFCGRQLWHR